MPFSSTAELNFAVLVGLAFAEQAAAREVFGQERHMLEELFGVGDFFASDDVLA